MNANQRPLGIFLTCLSFFGFTVMDVILKWIGVRSPVIEAFDITTAVAALLIFLYGVKTLGLAALKTSHLRLHTMRGLLYFVQFMMVIYSFRHMTLANFYALVFTAPLFITVLSSIFLKHEVGWRRWTATIVGFVGVLIVLRPTADLQLVSVFVLLAALIYSGDVIFMQIANRKDATPAVMLYPIAISLIPGGLCLPFGYTPLAVPDFFLLTVCGLLMASSSLLILVGFRLATPPVGAPFHYTQLIWGTAAGWAIWNELPDLWTGIGAAIIAGSGLYILHRETRRKESLTAEADLRSPHV